MPIYEFECRACGHRFSEFYRTMHSAKEGLAPHCPACQSADVQRVVSSFALHGPARADAQEAAAEKAAAGKLASVTPKEQIEKWRSDKQSGSR